GGARRQQQPDARAALGPCPATRERGLGVDPLSARRASSIVCAVITGATRRLSPAERQLARSHPKSFRRRTRIVPAVTRDEAFERFQKAIAEVLDVEPDAVVREAKWE